VICKQVIAKDVFYIDQHEIKILSRYNDFQNTVFNPENILSLEKKYVTTRYYSNIWWQPKDYFLVHLKPRLKIHVNETGNKSGAEFDEAYATFIPINKLFIDLGKKNIRWGTAYAWNLVNIFDLDNRFIKEENNFQDVIYAQYYINDTFSLSLSTFLNHSDYAFKLHGAFHQIDYDFLYLNQNKESKIGFDVSTTLGDSLEFHAEVLGQKGTSAYFPTNPTQNIYAWEKTKNNQTIFTSFVIGTQYTTIDNTNIVFEYFYNGTGLSNSEYDLALKGINESLSGDKYKVDSPWRGFLLNSTNFYRFSQLRKNYLFFRVSKDKLFEKISMEWNNYYSIDDQGLLLLPELKYKVSDYFYIKNRFFLPIGNSSSEFKRFYEKYVSIEINLFF